MKNIIFTVAMVANANIASGGIYFCTSPGGDKSMQDTPCSMEQKEIGRVSSYGAVNSGFQFNQNAKDQVYVQPIIRGHRSKVHGAADRPRTLGYGDKTRIRELEMQRGQLEDQRKRAGRNHGSGLPAYGISQEIRSINEQIRDIRNNPTGH